MQLLLWRRGSVQLQHVCVSVSGSDGNSICFVEIIIKQTCKAVTWQNASQPCNSFGEGAV